MSQPPKTQDVVEAGAGSTGPAEPPSGRLSKRPLILEAATALFAARPFREVLMDDVAKEAGVGKGTVYRYFKDKEDLFFCCIKTALESAFEAVHDVRHDEEAPYSERLARTIERLAQFYVENQRLLHILHHHASLHDDERHQEMRELWRRLRRVIMNVVEKGMEAGEFRKLDPEAATVVIHSTIRALAHDRKDLQTVAETAKTILLEGIVLHK